MTTTRELRAMARDHEHRLSFGKAAALYAAAADAYPPHHPHSALAVADVANLRLCAESCATTARNCGMAIELPEGVTP